MNAEAFGKFGDGLAFDEAARFFVRAVFVALLAFHVGQEFEVEKATQTVVES